MRTDAYGTSAASAFACSKIRQVIARITGAAKDTSCSAWKVNCTRSRPAGFMIYRSLTLRALFDLLVESAETSAVILVVIGPASVFAWASWP